MRPKVEFPDGTAERMEYLLNKVDNADELQRINDCILALAAQFKDHTIEKVMARDDIELALEFLAANASALTVRRFGHSNR